MCKKFDEMVGDWGGEDAMKEVIFLRGENFGENWNLYYDSTLEKDVYEYKDSVSGILEVSEIIHIWNLGKQDTIDYINTRANRLLNEQEEIA